MVKIPDKIKTIIDKFIIALKQNNFSYKSMYLFGSYARATENEWRDIDIALISDEFEGIRFFDKDKIRDIKLSVSTNLDVIPFNTNDFSMDDPLAREIIETGFRIV